MVIDDPAHAIPLTDALLEGGIGAIELTLRTPAAFECLRRIREHCPNMLAGLGTLLTTDQVRSAASGGAAFAVAPGLNSGVVRFAQVSGLPFAPGIMTPSDIEGAVQLNCRLLKFFPAESCGGVDFLKLLSAPYAHLGLEFIPLGGLNESNFTDYLDLEYVPAVGGSWIAPRDVIQRKDWSAIRENALHAMAKISQRQ